MSTSSEVDFVKEATIIQTLVVRRGAGTGKNGNTNRVLGGNIEHMRLSVSVGGCSGF